MPESLDLLVYPLLRMENILHRSVLVLNRFWQPIHTCTAQRAVQLLALGHARVMQMDGEQKFETHDFPSWCLYSELSPAEDVIRSISISLRVPQILVLGQYDKIPHKEVTFSRKNVFLRDEYECQYCSKIFQESDLNLDHVIPRQKGGKTNWENIVTSCKRCNTRKANKMPHEANMHPRKHPAAPRWRPYYGLRGRAIDDTWRHFIEPNRDQVKMVG